MAALERTVTVQIQALQYIPADETHPAGFDGNSPEENNAHTQRVRLRQEFGKHIVWGVEVSEGEGVSITVHHYQSGHPSVAYVLRPEDWLVEDASAEGGYRVVPPLQLNPFLQGRTENFN